MSETVAWKARFIITQDGGVDLPHDRHHCTGPKEQHGAFLDQLGKALPPTNLFATIKAKLVAREIKTREAEEIVLFEGDGIRCIGNSNASAGYFYVTATRTETA
jgi:hypothetical protein